MERKQISSAEEFVRLRKSQNPDEYGIAADGIADESVWHEVIEHYPDMKGWVIHNKTIPISILEELAEDPDPDVRREVANKRKLTEDLFLKLSQDENRYVRQRIAYNAKVPTYILERLAQDSEDEVRQPATEKLRARLAKETPSK